MSRPVRRQVPLQSNARHVEQIAQGVLVLDPRQASHAGPALAEQAFVPNVFVDVSETLRQKLRIMGDVFESELQGPFMPRGLSALEALARHRGAAIGVEFAEAFMLMREIV